MESEPHWVSSPLLQAKVEAADLTPGGAAPVPAAEACWPTHAHLLWARQLHGECALELREAQLSIDVGPLHPLPGPCPLLPLASKGLGRKSKVPTWPQCPLSLPSLLSSFPLASCGPGPRALFLLSLDTLGFLLSWGLCTCYFVCQSLSDELLLREVLIFFRSQHTCPILPPPREPP